MDWKPGAAWPFRPGGSAEPHAMQLPASVRQVIDPTYWDNTSPIPIDVAAGTLLRQYIPDISNFIQRQRQAYSLGSADYHRMRGTAPQLLVDYINNSGQEIITVTLQPTTSSSTTTSGGCIVFTGANQFFYAQTPSIWQEVDFPLPVPATSGSFTQLSYDVFSKQFYIGYGPNPLTSNTGEVLASTTGAKWSTVGGPWGGYGELTVAAYMNTGLLATIPSEVGTTNPQEWSIGGTTWAATTFAPFTLNTSGYPAGLVYPAGIWQGQYVQYFNDFVAVNALTDVNGNQTIIVDGPTSALSNGSFNLITAGNGLLAGNCQDPTTNAYQLCVSADNSSWTTIDSVGSILGTTTASSYATFAGPYNNFAQAVSTLTYVPAWKLFVFAVNPTVTIPSNTYQNLVPDGFTGIQFTTPNNSTIASTAYNLAPGPVQIYTSPDMVTWTLQFTASYTNGSAPPSVTTTTVPAPPIDVYVIELVGTGYSPGLDPIPGYQTIGSEAGNALFFIGDGATLASVQAGMTAWDATAVISLGVLTVGGTSFTVNFLETLYGAEVQTDAYTNPSNMQATGIACVVPPITP